MISNTIIICLTVGFLAIVFLLYKSLGVIQYISRDMVKEWMRDAARQRHDDHGHMQKLLEKLHAPDPMKIAIQHGNERVHIGNKDAQVDMATIDGIKKPATPTPVVADEFADPADAVYMQ